MVTLPVYMGCRWNSDTAIPDRGHSRCRGRMTGCSADLWSLIVRARYHLVLLHLVILENETVKV
jgi:hypothetical protein